MFFLARSPFISSGYGLLATLAVFGVSGFSLYATASEDLPASPITEVSPTVSEPVLEKFPSTSSPILKGKAQADEGTLEEPLQAKAVVVDIQSHTLNYDEKLDVYIATGAAHVVISEQNSELIADKVIYDQKRNLLFAEGHVVIIKNGQKTDGTYAKIDLTRESALISDPIASIEEVRIKAKKSLVNDQYVLLSKGKLIISQQTLSKYNKNQSSLRKVGSSMGSSLAQLAAGRPTPKNPLEPETFDPSGEDRGNGKFRLKAKEIEIKRGEDGFDEISLKWPSLYFGKFKVATMPSNEFAYDELSKSIYYEGPDLGYNPNLGGLYTGPGWDFRLGSGVARFSPLLTYGNPGGRNRNGAQFEKKDPGFGIGAIAHYRDKKNLLDLGYTSKFNKPVLYGLSQLTSTTRLQAAANNFYRSGLLGYEEQPGYILQITDSRRNIVKFKNFGLSTFASAGYAKDEFFPTNSSRFFVDPKEGEPQSAGRIQLQAQIQNIAPLYRVGNVVDFGFRGNVAFSGYTTGDALSLIRGGPTMNINIKNRIASQIAYYLATTSGETPFVFDSYYRGQKNLNMVNGFRVNDYLTVGTVNDLNLSRENAKDALAVGNSFFVLVGPKDIKLNLAYDFIRKRSYFGINFFPGSGNTVVDFDRLKLFQPQAYSGSAPTQ